MSEMDSSNKIQGELFGEIIKSLVHGGGIKIHTCFNVTVPANWGFESRINQDFHIVYIKGGQGYYDLESGQEPFAKGKIIFVSQGTLHSAVQDMDNPPQIIPLRFGIYDQITNMPLNVSSFPFSIAYTPNETEDFRLLFEKLYHYYSCRNIEHMELLCKSILTEIITQMYDGFINREETGTKDLRIEMVRMFMEQNPLSRLSGEELAEMSGLTRKYFGILFRQQTGLTPKEYQIRARIGYARFLLEEGKETIKSVAIATGYPDPYSFSKQFKMVMGFAPVKLNNYKRGDFHERR